MSEEYEVKFLNIDVEKIEKKLLELGAKKEFDRVYKVRIFDFPGFPLNEKAAWVRLRDEGDKIFLTYKQRLGKNVKDKSGAENDEGMKEVEVAVDNFESTVELLHSLGMIDKFYEEKRRIRYILNDIEFDIDHMPALEPFLEIEAANYEKVEEGIKMLDLNPEDKKIFSAFQIYQLAGINMLDYSEFRFDGLVKRPENSIQK